MSTEDEQNYRDAGTGQYVTQEYADAHPETTVAEPVFDQVPVFGEADPEQVRYAENLALMLSEQLGVPLQLVVSMPMAGQAPTAYVAFTVETASMLHQQGRKLVAR